ncbi:uncharacterized protein LY89DRAFT_679191 [Mollisia scopiformis]|uniref:2EXR domain-containing protein n=1 Tax=Mollisia scopiformis TaxID=149040 RepID=A0A194XUU6_MOLSC|nr:uncharacterized protein LY89DRAFT_679191 [Mollisia scopiformis]KUJ23911.1 hypothetical protein LY89DRAFT_679191 [Mollisia scopiformis]
MRQRRIDGFLVPFVSPSGRVAAQFQRLPLTEFPRFKDLPIELRISIWELASHQQRNLDIWNRELWTSDSSEDEERSVPHLLFTTQPPPSVLQACHESREEALKYYTFDFGTTYHDRDCTVTTQAKVYVNWAVDRICLMEPYELFQFSDDRQDPSKGRLVDLVNTLESKGRYLAINVFTMGDIAYTTARGSYVEHPAFCETLPKMGGLQELILFNTYLCRHKLKGTIVFDSISEESIDMLELVGAEEEIDVYFLEHPDFNDKTKQWYESLNVDLRRFKIIAGNDDSGK